MTSADRQSVQTPDNHAQKTRSATVKFGRLEERRSTPIWCRSAKISIWRAARERKTENSVERNTTGRSCIGLASPFRASANPMISERLKFPRTTVGLVAQIDANRSRVQLLIQKQRLVSLQNDLAKQKINLARMSGLPPSDHYELGDGMPFQAGPAMSFEDSLK